ncbi:MAG: hypothetical protein ACOYMN_26135, partial [Roseimicrobium sp.]
MKTSFSLIAALGFASVASAADYSVYITGSTAGRASVHTSIQALLTSPVTTANNATLGSAGKANFVGTIGSDTVTVYCAWSGSAEGVQALDQNLDVTFMAETGGGTVITPTNLVHKADIAFSDVFQSSTIYNANALGDTSTIVLPFRFYSSEGSPLTNVTSAHMRALFGVGIQPLATLTGNSAHRSAAVVATGRNNQSGTRITTMAEIGYGVFNNVIQYKPTITGAEPTANAAAMTNVANGGESSGGTVAGNLSCTTTGLSATVFGSTYTPCYFVGYVGLSDGTTAANNGAAALNYNGVAYGADAVREGSYTLW